MKLAIIYICIIATLMSLPLILPQRPATVYSDDALRAEVLSRGMQSMPTTFEELVEITNAPHNPLTMEKIALGKELYFDTLLSKDRDISCATCHVLSKNPDESKTVLLDTMLTPDKKITNCNACHLRDESGTDRFDTAIGHNATPNPYHLNTQSILNTSLAKTLTWDGDVKNVEEQTALTLQTPFEMNMTPQEVEERLKADPAYVAQFTAAFKNEVGPGEETVSFENTTKAIGAYVRTLITRGDYDRFLDGDNDAMSAEAKRGLTNFLNFGCKGCHAGITVGGQSIQKFPLRKLANFDDMSPNLAFEPEFRVVSGDFPFENIGNFLGREDTQLFRVPILRNVTKTSPYFHNGAIAGSGQKSA